MKKVLLAVAGMTALAVTASSLAAAPRYTAGSFNGTYRGQLTVTVTTTCAGHAPVRTPVKPNTAYKLTVANGTAFGSPITGISQILGTGTAYISQHANGGSVTGRIVFSHSTLTNAVSFFGTLHGTAAFKTCRTVSLSTMRGSRVSMH